MQKEKIIYNQAPLATDWIGKTQKNWIDQKHDQGKNQPNNLTETCINNIDSARKKQKRQLRIQPNSIFSWQTHRWRFEKMKISAEILGHHPSAWQEKKCKWKKRGEF